MHRVHRTSQSLGPLGNIALEKVTIRGDSGNIGSSANLILEPNAYQFTSEVISLPPGY